MLVDTSVWVEHFRRGNARLAGLLDRAEVLCHSSIIGELACGQLRNRQEILALLAALPQAPRGEDEEALAFVEARRLMGRGLGWVDVHLVASAMLAGASLWTVDRALGRAAAALGLEPPRH